MIPRLALAGTKRHQTTHNSLYLIEYFYLYLAPAGTGRHRQAMFFNGINHGIVAHKIRAATKYHVMLFSVFMVLKIIK
jgi:hypothetical protein